MGAWTAISHLQLNSSTLLHPAIQGMNFSLNADPEPDLLLAILRQISLIENKQESRRRKRMGNGPNQAAEGFSVFVSSLS